MRRRLDKISAADIRQWRDDRLKESFFNSNGVTLSQLVSPPLPIVDGAGENGNYTKMTDSQFVSTYRVYIDSSDSISVSDLINLHNAHAA